MRKGRAQRKSRNARSTAPKSSQRIEKLGAAGASPSTATPTRDVPVSEEIARTEPSPRLAEQVAAVSALVEEAEKADKAEPVAIEETTPRAEPVATVASDGPSSLQPIVKAAETKAAEEPGADEISIPPAGDLHIDEHDERFFSEGDLSHHAHASHDHHEDDWDDVKPASRKHEPHVVQRRERFARYVKWAVAGAAVLCLAAVGRSAMTTKSAVPAPVAAAAAKPAPEPVKAAEPTPEAKPAEPVKAAEPAPEAKPADTKPEGAVDAKAEKTASRRALESGKLDAAIAAGERAVAADAEDGEAWLILGAAYQEKGKLADARRCYSACTKQGKRGPIGECAAMLR